MSPAIFLDRDGVLNRDRVDYAYRPEHFEILPGVPDALRRLKAAGYRLVVITNQSGIAKGLYTPAEVRACHAQLQAASGHALDALYYAPGHPSVSESLSRKPGTLMIERATARFQIDRKASWLIGDSARDLQAGRAAGVGRLVHVLGKEAAPGADHTVRSLAEATDLILK